MESTYSVANSYLPSFLMASSHCLRTGADKLVRTMVNLTRVFSSVLVVDKLPVNFLRLLKGGEQAVAVIGVNPILMGGNSLGVEVVPPIENRALICCFFSILGAWTGVELCVLMLRLCLFAMDSTEMGKESLGNLISAAIPAKGSSSSKSGLERFPSSRLSRLLKSLAFQLHVAIVFLLESCSSFPDPSLDEDTVTIKEMI